MTLWPSWLRCVCVCVSRSSRVRLFATLMAEVCVCVCVCVLVVQVVCLRPSWLRCVCVCVLVVQVVCDSLQPHGLYVAHHAPPSVEFCRQEYWSGRPRPSPGDLPDPEIEPRPPALQADALPSEPPGKPILMNYH